MFCSASSADPGGSTFGLREVLGVAHGDDGDADAAVERRQELRQRPAARLAAAADPIGIDLRARQQVVDPADAVPRAEQAEVRAEQDEAASGVLVLARSAAERRLAGPASRILDAFTLPERVVGEDDVALAREIREQLLVARPRLAVHRMPQRAENRRAASRSSRHIEVRRHVESRPALERHLLDSIAGPLDGAGHAGIEGSAIERPSQHLPELRDDVLLPVEDLLPRRDRVDDSFAPFARIVRQADQVSLEIAGIVRQRGDVDAQLHARRACLTAPCR